MFEGTSKNLNKNGVSLSSFLSCQNTCTSFLVECGTEMVDWTPWCIDPDQIDNQGNAANNQGDGQGGAADVSLCVAQLGDNAQLLGNGICNDGPDLNLNIPGCSYDGGDCCVSTCGGGVCAADGFFNCLDPNAAENAPPPASVTLKEVCLANSLFCQPSGYCGDGYCDIELNNPACGYDGGDWYVFRFICRRAMEQYTCLTSTSTSTSSFKITSCEDTCDPTAAIPCGIPYPDYDECLDPASENPSVVLPEGCLAIVNNPHWVGKSFLSIILIDCSQIENSFGSLLTDACTDSEIGDGICDAAPRDGYNTAECGYDGGDCCPQTCVGEFCSTFESFCIQDLNLSDECLLNIQDPFWLGEYFLLCVASWYFVLDVCSQFDVVIWKKR
jgi:hypothetical protein